MFKVKALVLADRVHESDIERYKDQEFDFILTLWDITWYDIGWMKRHSPFKDKPILWVYWNHCSRWYLEQYECTNLHCNIVSQTINWKTITLWWFEGSLRYKEGDDVLYTQEESVQLVKQHLNKYVDILVLHSPPEGINNWNDFPHYGLEGTKLYVDEFSPQHLFHWHTYKDENFIERYIQTEIHYVYWVEIVEFTIYEEWDQRPYLQEQKTLSNILPNTETQVEEKNINENFFQKLKSSFNWFLDRLFWK